MESLALLVWLAIHAAGQAVNPKPSQAQPPAVQQEATDSLGRSTPRGTFTGFVRAVHRDDFVSAARFMQVTTRQQPTTAALARELNQLTDRYLTRSLASISDSPAGALDDGLPLDRERLGPLEIRDNRFDVILVRIKDPESGLIWLISSETLAQVPIMYGAMEETWIERLMPQGSLNRRFLEIPVAYWGAWGISIGIPFLLLGCSRFYYFFSYEGCQELFHAATLSSLGLLVFAGQVFLSQHLLFTLCRSTLPDSL